MRIIFYNPINRMFRHDGDEFTARAKDCLVYWQRQGHEVKMCPIPKASDAEKRMNLRLLLQSYDHSVDRIAVFGHGTSTWCDLGLTVKSMEGVADVFRSAITADARIGLYCCLTGKAVNGLAGTLSAALGVPVLSHTTSGHTSRNPNKRLFYVAEYVSINNAVAHGISVYRDLMPTDKADRKAWIAKLQTDKTAPFEALESAGLEGWAKS